MPWFNRDGQRIGPPPVGTPASLQRYLADMAEVINRLPRMSYFSGTSPASSGVTGLPGDLAMNIGSTSTTSRLWIKGGTGTTPSTTGWAVVRVLE